MISEDDKFADSIGRLKRVIYESEIKNGLRTRRFTRLLTMAFFGLLLVLLGVSTFLTLKLNTLESQVRTQARAISRLEERAARLHKEVEMLHSSMQKRPYQRSREEQYREEQ